MSRLPILLLLLIACVPASARAQGGSSAPPPCNAPAYKDAVYEGRWQDALAETERCYVGADRRSAGRNEISFDGGERTGYRFYAAQLLAWTGRIEDAEAVLRDAASLSEAIGFGFLVPTAEMIAVTDAFIHERSGTVADARARYARLDPDVAAAFGAAGRAALLALAASDEDDARRWGNLGAEAHDPAARFVLGALAEAHGDRAAARAHYQSGLTDLAGYAARNPSSPLWFLEQQRIRAALARLTD